MIVFMLTTEGYSREDGNVYYSHPLIVHTHEGHKPTVEQVIAKALEPYRGRMDAADYILFDASFDSPGDDYDRVWQEVEDALNAAGYHAERPHVTYLIADTRTPQP